MELNFVGKQKWFPRIGEDYQVELPDVLGRSDYFNHETSSEAVKSHALDYFLGVSLPVTSINQLDDKKLEHEELVPGSARDSWNEADKASFILGLYIFSKKFAWLKQCLESKKMEDMLSFYYGEFYRSHDYCGWSESRKTRKRGVVGRKIFTGHKKQQLLSRILPSLSEERKNTTLQVLKTFQERKNRFKNFMFSINEIIGILEAVEERCRTNPVVPTGKRTKSTTEGMKFIVVDTCSGDWKPYQVRGLSGLTFETYRCSVRRNDDPVQVLRPRSNYGRALANENGNNEKQRKGKWKCGMEEDNSHNVLPVIKRRRLIACNNEEPSMPEVAVTRGQEITKRIVVVALPAASGKLRPEKRKRYSRVRDDKVDESMRCSSSTIPNAECDDISDSQQAVRIRNNFDLNFLPPDSENESDGGEHEDETGKSQLNDVSPQRRGTRNRPPTARALEAVAYGFLSGRARNVREGPIRARGETEELPDVHINPVESIIHQGSQSHPSRCS